MVTSPLLTVMQMLYDTTVLTQQKLLTPKINKLFQWEVKHFNLLLDVVVSPQMQNPNNFMHDSCENGKLTIPTFHDHDERQHRRRTLDR